MKTFTKLGTFAAIIVLSVGLTSCSPASTDVAEPKPDKVSILEGEAADAAFQEVDVVYLNALENNSNVKISLEQGSMVSLQGATKDPQYDTTWTAKVADPNIVSFVEPVFSKSGEVKAYASITGEEKGETVVSLSGANDITVKFTVVVK